MTKSKDEEKKTPIQGTPDENSENGRFVTHGRVRNESVLEPGLRPARPLLPRDEEVLGYEDSAADQPLSQDEKRTPPDAPSQGAFKSHEGYEGVEERSDSAGSRQGKRRGAPPLSHEDADKNEDEE